MNDGKKSGIIWLILLSVLVILLIAYAVFHYVRKRGATMIAGGTTDNSRRLDVANVIVSGLVQRGLSEQEARYWTAVSAHETAGWTSDVWQHNRNPWGMRQPQQRSTTSAGEVGGYASYDTMDDALDDLMLWMDSRQFQRQHDSLRKLTADMRAKGYYEDDYLSYTNACLRWYAQLFGGGNGK